MPQVWFALHPPYPSIWTAHKALAPPLLYALRQLPFNKTFPLVCFALLTFFSLFSSVSSTPWAERQLQRLKLLLAPILLPSPLLPPLLINQTAEMKRCWYKNRGIGGKERMAGGLKRNVAAKKSPNGVCGAARWTWGSPVTVKRKKKNSGRVITAGIQWAIKDDAVLSGGSPKGMCVYLCPRRETRLNEREWLLCECLRKSGHVHTNRLIPGSEQH